VKSELLFGLHTVRQALASRPELALEIWLQDSLRKAAGEEIEALAAAAGLRVQRAPRAALTRLAGGEAHQGVVLRRRPPAPLGEADLDALPAQRGAAFLALVLDGVHDPHNLGACLRAANGAGCDVLVMPASRGPGLTPAARKVASGAAELTPLAAVRNLARALAGLAERGVRIVGAAGEAEAPIYALELAGPLALVIGAEDKGLRRLTRSHCDTLARIPLAGGVASLNMATAAAVCLFEAVRQRRFAPGAPLA